MAASLVATVGASDANAYDTIANAKSYFDNHPEEATWDALSDDDMARYLILATTLIDLEPIAGDKYDTTTTSGAPDQALRFPRVVDYIDATLIIPVAVKTALYEQALELGKSGSANMRSTLQSQGVKRIKLSDGSEEEYTGTSQATALCNRARKLLVNAGLLRLAAAWG